MMIRPPARNTSPLLDLRTFVILASAVIVGVLVAASDGIGAAIAAGLGAAAALHALIDRERRDRR